MAHTLVHSNNFDLSHSTREVTVFHRIDRSTQLWDRLGTVETWMQRSHQRRQLRQILDRSNDHLLRDMGLTYSQAESEASKPFWRA